MNIHNVSENIALILGLAALTPACAADKVESQKKIALVVGVANEPFYLRMIQGAQTKADQLGAQLIVRQPAKWDADLQTAAIDEVIGLGVDALIAVPVDSDKMIAPLQRAHDAGITVLTTDQFINATFPVSSVRSDNAEGGAKACETLSGVVGATGTVMIENVVAGISATDAREQGCRDWLTANAPGIVVLDTAFSNDDRATAKAQILQAITDHPDLVGVFTTNVVTGEGAVDALAEAPRSVAVVAFDAPSAVVPSVVQGAITALIAQKPSTMGDLGVEFSIDSLQGVEIPKQRFTGFVVIDKTNVDTSEIKQFVY